MSKDLREQIAAALRAAAHDCDGTCGLTETDCFEQHPIQVSVSHFGQVSGVYGYIDALAAIAAEAVQPELDRIRAEPGKAQQQPLTDITIRTRKPGKWRFVDTETGQVWVWDVGRGTFKLADTVPEDRS